MLVLEWKERAFIEKVNSRYFVDFRRPYWCTKTVHQYSVSIQSSTKVCETFRQITQKLWATKTWDLDKLFIYQSFITFHFLGFFHWAVSNLFFCCVKTSFKTHKSHTLREVHFSPLTCALELLWVGKIRDYSQSTSRRMSHNFVAIQKLYIKLLNSVTSLAMNMFHSNAKRTNALVNCIPNPETPTDNGDFTEQ